MKKHNNFNQSDTGINIELGTHLDLSLCEMFFNRDFKKLEDEDKFLYTCENQLKSEIDYDILPESIPEIKKYLEKVEELTDINDTDILTEFENCYFESDFDRYETCLEYNIKSKREQYEEIDIFGYNQGDSNTVLINIEEYKELTGIEKINLKNLKEEFENIFYDIPQSVRVTVNEIDFESPSMNCWYKNYDKTIFIKEILEEFTGLDQALLKSELEKILPDELEVTWLRNGLLRRINEKA